MSVISCDGYHDVVVASEVWKHDKFDESTRRYHLGLKPFVLAARVSTAHGSAGAALPILRELAASTQEAALMSVLEGQHQLYVHYVKGPRQ